MPSDAEHAREIAAILGAAAHPVRVLALAAFAEGPRSPIELSGLLGGEYELGTVAYHVRRLAAAGAIELAESIPRRGAVEHRYALTARGRALADAIDRAFR